MQRGEPLIYSGRNSGAGIARRTRSAAQGSRRICRRRHQVRRRRRRPGGKFPPKVHYAVQLALYTDILERKKLSPGRHAFVWDIHGGRFHTISPNSRASATRARSGRTMKSASRNAAPSSLTRNTPAPRTAVHARTATGTQPASKHWQIADDLTMIPRDWQVQARRDVCPASNRWELAANNPESFVNGTKTVFAGIGLDTLQKFLVRAKLLRTKDARPSCTRPSRSLDITASCSSTSKSIPCATFVTCMDWSSEPPR